jgi:Uma2 family endonuclease
MATVVETLLTADEFLNLPDDGVPKELVRGKVVLMNLPAPRHGYICGNIVGIIRPFVVERQLGRVMCNDSSIKTQHSPDTVRGADAAFYSFKRLPPGPLPAGYIDVAPELVFEVRSPTDRWRDIRAKVTEYLEAGVTTVCVLDSTTETVHAYNNDEPDRVFRAEEELTLPEVLPEFRTTVRSFFE